MNVLVVCKLAEHTLLENVLSPLLKASDINHIYVLRDIEGPMCDGRVSYITPRIGKKGKFRHIIKFIKASSLLRKNCIDAIIGVHIYPHGYLGERLARRFSIPYIHMTIAGQREFWVHGEKEEKRNIKIFQKAAAITATGTVTKDYLVNKGFDKDNVYLLPNLPNVAFSTVPVTNERKYDLVSFSRIDANKNVQLLVKALSKLKKDLDLKVAVAGDGDQLENVKALAKELGVADLIDFFGYVSGIEPKIKLLSDSKIFVSCSKGEGFPISLLEAMSCGCVPVVSNVGDIVDVVQQRENGFVFEDTDNENELVQCLRELLSDEARLSGMRIKAYAIRDVISVENNGKIWSEILSKVVKHG